MHKIINKMENDIANLEQTNDKLKFEFAEKEKNFSYEKSSFLDENRNLNNL